MALIGLEADHSAINRIQVLPFNQNFGAPTSEKKILFFSTQKYLESFQIHCMRKTLFSFRGKKSTEVKGAAATVSSSINVLQPTAAAAEVAVDAR